MHGLLFRRRKDICIFPWLSTVRYSLESKLFGQRWAKLVTVRDSVETKQSNCRGQRSVSGTALRTIFLIYDFFLLHVHICSFLRKILNGKTRSTMFYILYLKKVWEFIFNWFLKQLKEFENLATLPAYFDWVNDFYKSSLSCFWSVFGS